MILKRVSFEEESPFIRYSFQLDRFHSTLIVQFSGKYRDGSRGNPDAALMAGILQAAIKVWDPKNVIIDLSNLTYTWGNSMLEVLANPLSKSIFTFNPEDIPDFKVTIPTAVVVGQDNRKALSSLFYGEGTERDITEFPNYFDSVQEAFNYLQTIE